MSRLQELIGVDDSSDLLQIKTIEELQAISKQIAHIEKMLETLQQQNTQHMEYHNINDKRILIIISVIVTFIFLNGDVSLIRTLISLFGGV